MKSEMQIEQENFSETREAIRNPEKQTESHGVDLPMKSAVDLAETDAQIRQVEGSLVVDKAIGEIPAIENFKKQMAALRERAQAAYQKFSQGARTAVLAGAILASPESFGLSQTVEAGIQAKQKAEQTTKEKETAPQNATEQQLWDSVENSKNEQAYISMMVDGKRELRFLNDMGTTGGIIKIPELPPNATNIEMLHTHTKEVYGTFSSSPDKSSDAPLPPSELDALEAIKMAVKSQGKIGSSIYEPSGVWHLKPDINNPFVKRVGEFYSEVARAGEGLAKHLEEGEARELEKVDAGQTDVRTVIEILQQNPKTRNLGEKLAKTVDELIAKYPDVAEGFGTDEIAGKITSEGLNRTSAESTDVASYIEKMKKAGVAVSYEKRK